MSRLRRHLPPELLALGQDPAARGLLLACSLAVAAAGLDPRVLGPNVPNVQEALRLRPQFEGLYLAAVVGTACCYLLGGALGDLAGRRRVLLAGLAGLVAAELASAAFADGWPFTVARLAAVASVGLVVPVALAAVAMAYQGLPRAMAIGICYAAYGAALGVAPALLNAVTPKAGRWPSFLLAAALALLALGLARRRVPANPVDPEVSRIEVGGHALWGFGLLAITVAVVGVGGAPNTGARLLLLGAGVLALLLFGLLRARGAGPARGAQPVRVRPVTVALVAGVVIAIAQTAPLLQAPLFFQIAQGYRPLAALLATAPALLALVAAGPLAGLLLARLTPRVLIAGGLAAVGLGDLLMALVSPDTPYLYFVLPFLAVGAGFVVGTTIRTAVIFANVPRRLPATAAALNETSILIGGNIGIAIVTTIVAQVAASSFSHGLAGLAPAAAASDRLAFQEFLRAINTAAFGQMVAELGADTAARYGAAYASGVAASMLAVGLVALAAAAFAWFALGQHERLDTVWAYRDER